MKQYPCHMYDLEQGCFSPKVSRAALLLLGSELHYWENQGYSELLHEVLPTSVLIWEHSWVMNTGISRWGESYRSVVQLVRRDMSGESSLCKLSCHFKRLLKLLSLLPRMLDEELVIFQGKAQCQWWAMVCSWLILWISVSSRSGEEREKKSYQGSAWGTHLIGPGESILKKRYQECKVGLETNRVAP